MAKKRNKLIEDILWGIEEVLIDIKYIPHRVRNFFRCVARAFSWGVFMFNNREWYEPDFFLMLKKRLEEKGKFLRAQALLHESDKSCRQIKLALTYLDIALNSHKYTDKLWELHEEKYGKLSMISEDSEPGARTVRVTLVRSKCKTEEERNKASKVSSRIIEIEWYIFRKYLNKFYNMLKKYSHTWGD